jgi:hypothetical protein
MILEMSRIDLDKLKKFYTEEELHRDLLAMGISPSGLNRLSIRAKR